MKNPVLYKTLVVGVIILFIGVGIQPAFADVSNISISDSKDDCNLCPKLSKQHIVRIKGLIDRLDTLNTKLSKVSKLNPELEEKYQEISDRISTLTEINIEIKTDWDFPFICSSLFILTFFLIFIIILTVVIPIYHDFPMVEFMLSTIDFLGYKLGCPWYVHPP